MLFAGFAKTSDNLDTVKIRRNARPWHQRKRCSGWTAKGGGGRLAVFCSKNEQKNKKIFFNRPLLKEVVLYLGNSF
jgi:hypothetical protein